MFRLNYIFLLFSITYLLNTNVAIAQTQSLSKYVSDKYVLATSGNEKIETTENGNQQPQSGGFLEEFYKQIDPQKQQLTESQAQEIAFKLVCQQNNFQTSIINQSFIDKMEIVCGGERQDVFLLNTIIDDHIITRVGKAFTALTFCHPTLDKEILHDRQHTIALLSKNKPFINALDKVFTNIHSVESKSFIFWHSRPPVNSTFLGQFYFGNVIDFGGALKSLNTSTTALELTNRPLQMFHAASGLFAMPILVINSLAYQCDCSYGQATKMFVELCKNLASSPEISMRQKAFYSLVFAYQGLVAYLIGNQMKNSSDMCNHLQEMLIATATHINELKKLSFIVNNNKSLLKHFPFLAPLAQLTQKSKCSAKLNKLLNMLDTNTFVGEPSFFSLTGRVLATYELMKQVKDELIPAIVAAGELDMYCALAKLYNSRIGKEAQYCLVEFIENDTPIIEAHGFWNPYINPDEVVINDTSFGQHNPNSILTGPNTGGKSTVIKSIMLNLLMAQTFGMAPSKSLKMTPFTTLNCFMNISDDIAAGSSLFKAEVKRAKLLLDMVQELAAHEFSFIIIDEIFTGTSPQEGEEAAYRFSKKLGEYKNNISIIATHYPKMIDLEEETKGTYRNHHVEILRNDDGSLNRTFKLKTGPSRMNVAFDILAQEGLLF